MMNVVGECFRLEVQIILFPPETNSNSSVLCLVKHGTFGIPFGIVGLKIFSFLNGAGARKENRQEL